MWRVLAAPLLTCVFAVRSENALPFSEHNGFEYKNEKSKIKNDPLVDVQSRIVSLVVVLYCCRCVGACSKCKAVVLCDRRELRRCTFGKAVCCRERRKAAEIGREEREFEKEVSVATFGGNSKAIATSWQGMQWQIDNTSEASCLHQRKSIGRGTYVYTCTITCAEAPHSINGIQQKRAGCQEMADRYSLAMRCGPWKWLTYEGLYLGGHRDLSLSPKRRAPRTRQSWHSPSPQHFLQSERKCPYSPNP